MSSIRAVQRIALDTAIEHFDRQVRKVLEAADGDKQVLVSAAVALHMEPKDAGKPEHVAITLLCAAYEVLWDTEEALARIA